MKKHLSQKALSLLLALVLSLSMLTGCAPQVTPTTAPTTAAPATTAPAQTEAEEDDYFGILTAEEADLSVRDVKAQNGVVATASPIASKVGLEILQNGGNAVDAAVAVGFALGMVEPNASGIGGDGYMMVYNAETKETTFLDYKAAVPAALTSEIFDNIEKLEGGNEVPVPGMLAGMYKANELFGTMDMKDLLAPTIDFAENGVPVTSFMASTYLDCYASITKNEAIEKLFVREDGFTYEEGDIFRNPDYAETLKRIAQEGPDLFYKGEIGQALVDAVQADGGYVTMEDLANYEAQVKKPVSTTYRGYTVQTAPPGSAGVMELAILNMLEPYDIASMGHNSAETLHLLAEIIKLTTIDRYVYVADPDFYDITPMLTLASKEYANERLKLVSEDEVIPAKKSVLLEMDTISQMPIPESITDDNECDSTTHVSIIDKDGNMVAMTNTISNFFGSKVVVDGYGFVLHDQGANISKTTSWSVNNPNPGMHIRSTIAPTFVFDEAGNPILNVGTPGGGRILTTIPQIIVNMVDFGMDLQEAINQPRVTEYYYTPLRVEGHMDPDVVTELEAMGHEIEMRDSMDYYFGGVQGVAVDPETGELHGAADPRRDGKALGY